MKAKATKMAVLFLTLILTCTCLYSDCMLVDFNNPNDTDDIFIMKEDAILAGINGVISGYLSDTTDDNAGISSAGNQLMGSGQLTSPDIDKMEVSKATIYGFENLGIAQTEDYLDIRQEPISDAKIIGKLPNNAGCEIISVEDSWAKISSGEVHGYVSTEHLIVGEDAIQKAEQVKINVIRAKIIALFIRKEPNPESQIISIVPRGTAVEVLESLDGWDKIKVGQDEGFVSTDSILMTEELQKAMTINEFKYGKGVSDLRVSLVEFACQFIGNPYVWGGTSLTNGADCSGFVQSVYAEFGYSLPKYSVTQSYAGTRISASKAKPGDLFFYGNANGINHVAIYIGNGKIVHASNPQSGIKISNAYYATPLKVVKIIKN